MDLFDYKDYLPKEQQIEPYTQQYIELIENAIKCDRKRYKKSDDRYVYYENHHILPKSLFQQFQKVKENTVLLLPSEHFQAHKILTYIFPTKQMCYAFWKMCCCQKNERKVSAEEYEYGRLLRQKYPAPNRGIVVSDETRKKLSLASKSFWASGGYKHTEEQHKKAVETRKQNNGYIMTKEQNDKLKNSLKDRVWITNEETNKFIKEDEVNKYLDKGWRLGKKAFTDEHKQNIGKSLTGKKRGPTGRPGTFTGKHHTEETKEKIRQKKLGKSCGNTKKVVCVETGEVFNSIKEAEKLTGLNHIGNCCRGERKRCGKLHWKFLSEKGEEN